MRSHFFYGLISVLSLSSVAQAAFIESEAITREINVRAEVSGDQVRFEVRELWTNTSDALETVTWHQPTRATVETLQLYLDADGQSPAQVLDRYDYIAQQVERSENTNYFSLAKAPFSVLWSAELEIEPQTSQLVKYQWTEKIERVDDFAVWTLFLDPQKTATKLSVNVLWNGVVPHRLPLGLPHGSILSESGKTIWQFESADFVLPETIGFMWSQKPQASFRYARDEFLYEASFETPESTTDSGQRVLIMIDQSGSMYGNRWSRVESLLPEILKMIGSNNQVKIGLFDEEWSFLSDEFESNTFEQQKNWIEAIGEVIPTGKSDWSFWTSFVQSLSDSDRFDKIIVLGDFSDFQTPEDQNFWENYQKPVLFLDFGKNSDLVNWSRLFGGQMIVLYTSIYDLFELPSIEKAWQYLGATWVSQTFDQTMIDHEIRPIERDRLFDGQLVFINRMPKPENFAGNTSEHTQFLPAWWGQYQIAHHLEKNLQSTTFADDSSTAINALGNYFGLNFTEGLVNDFTGLDFFEGQHLVDRYLKSPQWTNLSRFWQGRPVSNGIPFGHQGVLDPNSPQNLQIKSFSPAYFQLYRDYPEWFTEFYAWGNQAQFCLAHRCVELSAEQGEESVSPAHRLFWDRSYSSHWADDYLWDLASRNILQVPTTGELELAQEITRGEFMSWVAQYLYPAEVQNYILPETPVFSDLPEDELMAQSLTLLKDKGIVEGFGNGLVKPDQILLRAEAVKILLALQGFTPSVNDFFLGEPQPFTDLGGWEKPWVLRAYTLNIVKGYEDKTFKPFKGLNRAEAAKLLVETLRD